MSDNGARSAYLDIISGRRRGMAAGVARCALAAVEPLYHGFMVARRAWYRFAARRAPLPVISIGNLTVGGTGKTPLVAMVARQLVALGHRPVIVSRGYKRKADSRGDEASAIRDELPDTVGQLETPKRYQGLVRLTAEKAYDVAVLDDGFQHVQLRRDLDIVAIDATQPFGYGHLLPRGLLREPKSALRHAQVVIITRWDQVGEAEQQRLAAEVGRHIARGARLLHASHAPRYLRTRGGERLPVANLAGRAVLAFCGLANPAAFFRTVEGLGARIVDRRAFADHYAYRPDDVAELLSAARKAGADQLVTTTKDFANLPSPREMPTDGGPDLLALGVEIELAEGAEALESVLADLVGVVGAGRRPNGNGSNGSKR